MYDQLALFIVFDKAAEHLSPWHPLIAALDVSDLGRPGGISMTVLSYSAASWSWTSIVKLKNSRIAASDIAAICGPILKRVTDTVGSACSIIAVSPSRLIRTSSIEARRGLCFRMAGIFLYFPELELGARFPAGPKRARFCAGVPGFRRLLNGGGWRWHLHVIIQSRVGHGFE